MIRNILFTTFTFLLLLITFISTLYAANYGDGEYENGVYGVGSSESNGSSGDSDSSGGSSSDNTSGACSDPGPTSAPNLFQIDAMQTSAILYFAPAGQPYSYYFISYGNGAFDEGYGAQFDLSNSTGSISYLVESLQPNSTYSFKVRAGNGCRTGDWSSTLRIKTTNSKNGTTKYYLHNQASGFTFDTVKGIVPALASKVKTPKIETQGEPFFTKTTPTPEKKTEVTNTSPQKTQTQTEQKQPSLFERILNFFGL